jgi:hypothetical protein
MTTNKYNEIFSIDWTKRRFYDKNTQTQSIVENDDKHEYDLNNENIYNLDGTLEKEAKQWQYENAFREFFIDSNLLKIESFLNWHYKKNFSSNSFFIYVKARIHNNSTISDGLKVIVGDWLKKNEKTINFSESNLNVILSFKDIFNELDYDKYIEPLKLVKPMLIDSKNVFAGKAHGHKGVICSWFSDLQDKSIINKIISRQKLAIVLNNEIQNFNLSSDGKTFNNTSKLYDKEFKEELFRLAGIEKLLP